MKFSQLERLQFYTQRKKNCVASDFATKCIGWHILQSVWKDHAACVRARALSCTHSIQFQMQFFLDNTMNYMFRYILSSRFREQIVPVCGLEIENLSSFDTRTLSCVVLHRTTKTHSLHVFNCIGVIFWYLNVIVRCGSWKLEVKHMHLIAKSITHIQPMSTFISFELSCHSHRIFQWSLFFTYRKSCFYTNTINDTRHTHSTA